jgi:glycosyltransferase involved in cell wall biosynthesis
VSAAARPTARDRQAARADRPSAPPHRPLRVAFLVDGFALGGTELNAVRTAEAVDREAYDLTVLGMRRDGPLLTRYAAADIPVVDFWFRGLRHPDAVPMTFRLARWLRQHRVDVLHCHDKYSNMFGALAGRMAGVPLVIASRRFQDFEGRRFAVGNAYAFRLAHRVLANSDGVARILADEGVDPAKIVVVRNFLDDVAFEAAPASARAAFRAELALPDDAIVIGCVARLDPIKDHESLITAFAEVRRHQPRAVLVLIGDGPHRAALEQHARTAGVADVVRFAGWRSNTVNLHRWFDVSTLASIAEGFPNVVIEAMAAGVPVVATDVGGVRDAVRDGETGLLVPSRDPAALAAALGRVVDDAALRARLARAGRALAESHYRREAVVPTVAALWETARGSGRGGRP